ncbi:MAG: HupE/UreJ family protein [Pikeienuella sp.]
MIRWLVAFLIAALSTMPAAAHVTELAVLSVQDRAPGAGGFGDGRYMVGWEMKPSSEFGATLQPIFPEHCVFDEPLLDCGDRGLVGQLGFEGIGQGQSAALFKVFGEGGVRVFTLTPAVPTALVAPDFDPTSWAGLAEIFGAYVQIGIEHILLGVDHLLFVLGLIWVARGGWMLVKCITAFTVAHSVTLVAVTFGWVGVPEVFVNAMIALSIAFIGVEVINAHRGEQTVTLRHPWAVSFGFGLLHGFGFANALIQLGLPDGAIPVALLAFNVGVEVGQLAFVFAVLALGWAYAVMRVTWPAWGRLIPAYVIGGLGAYWFIDRTATLIGA